MGADNYTICPNCNERADQEYEKAKANYGIIPRTEYEYELQKAVDKMQSVETTLREDYEFCIDPDEWALEVRYACSCKVCGFKWEWHKVFNLREQP